MKGPPFTGEWRQLDEGNWLLAQAYNAEQRRGGEGMRSHEDMRPITTEAKIASFADMPSGWYYGQGGPISETVRQIATGLNRFALWMGFEGTDAFPGWGGEIEVSAYHLHWAVKIIVEPDGTIDYWLDDEWNDTE